MGVFRRSVLASWVSYLTVAGAAWVSRSPTTS